MKHDKLQVAFAILVVVAAASMAVMGYGLYQQGRDIRHLQKDQAAQTQYLCERLAGLAHRIATRTDPIRLLLAIEASEAAGRGQAARAARLMRLSKQVRVPQDVECDGRKP